MSAGWRAFDRRAVPVAAVFMLGVAILAGVPTAIGLSDISTAVALAWVLPGAVLVVLAGAFAEWLRLRFSRYRIGPDRVELHTGVLIRTRRSLQRELIRTVDVTADPLQRVFGLVSVRIGTGEHADEGTVRLGPVARATGDELRRTLLSRVGGEAAEGTLAVLDPAWIRYAPLSFVAPALGASAIGGVLNVADWFGLADGVIGWAIDVLAGLGPLGAVVVLVGGALLVGAVGALGLWVEMWRGYRLDREPGGTLRVRRGLLTTRSISVEEDRLRGVEVVEPLGARLAGAARVDVVATGMAIGAQHDKARHRTLLPPAPRAVAERVAAEVLRDSACRSTLSPHPVAARGRRLRWALAAVLIGELPLIVLGLLLTDVLLHIAWITAVVAVPVAVALALDAYRSLGHGRHGEYLVARSGSVRRSTVALQRRGIVGWTVRQSVFQRRAGLATVWATTAAGSGAYAIRDVGTGTGLDVADAAVPGLLAPFLERAPAEEPSEARPDRVVSDRAQAPRLEAPEPPVAGRWLALTALAYALLHHLGAALAPLGTIGPTRWADWAEVLVPYAVLLPAAAALAANGAGRGVWAGYLVGAITYAEGKGIHVAANSIGNAGAGEPAHLWDEVVGHYGWYLGATLVFAALAISFAERDAPRGAVPYVLAMLVGVTHATNSLEGGTAVFGMIVAAVFGVWGWTTRTGMGRLLIVAYLPALLLLIGYGLWQGGFPQPSAVW